MAHSPEGHPDPLVLQSYVDGELSQEDSLALETHLGDCAACARLVAESRALVMQIRALPDTPLRRDLSGPIEARLRRPRTSRGLLWAAALELAAGLAIVAWAWPLAERSARTLLPLIQDVGLTAVRSLLSSWADPAQALLAPLGQALRFDLAVRLPSLNLAQMGTVVAAVAVLWAVGNIVLLRRTTAMGSAR